MQYYSDNYLTNCINARKAEMEGRWEDARKLRLALGHTEDVKAIDMILLATSLGDSFRRKTEGLNQLWEDRVINNTELNQRLTEAHKEVYGY